MNYMEEIERDFREVLKNGDVEATVQWLKDKVLQSFRNGQRGRSKIGKGQRRQPEPAQAS